MKTRKRGQIQDKQVKENIGRVDESKIRGKNEMYLGERSNQRKDCRHQCVGPAPSRARR